MSTRCHPLNSGRTMAVGVGIVGVVGLATLLAVLFKGGGTGDGGTGTGAGVGTGTGPATTQPLVSMQPERPLRVTIRENDYVVNGRPVDLVTLTGLAEKVPAGGGAAVMVERSPTSRAKAENDLKDALTKKGIPYTSD